MPENQITIVVVPRERFSLTRESLRSIYELTDTPFRLVYVDGGSPRKIKRFLESTAREKGFRLIRTDSYLSPNRARNIGLGHVSSKYVVFLDNDVLVAPGWLSPLVECAEDTGAAVVTPLTLECFDGGSPVVHFAGGECHIAVEKESGTSQRHLKEAMHHAGRKPDDIRSDLRRQRTEYAEFHCLLVRTDIFRQVGPFDEQLLNTREHIDFCLLVAQAGGDIYLEPSSVVTFDYGLPLAWKDIPYFLLRWSDAWELASLHRLRAKWALPEDEYFQRRYKNVGWRRRAFIERVTRSITFGLNVRGLGRLLLAVERVLNQCYVARHRTDDRFG
jgi:GT2 family glycosyltransferase